MSKKSPEDFGLTPDELYDEKALPYYLHKYDEIDQFILAMRNDFLQQIVGIRGYTTQLAKNEEIADTPILGETTVAQSAEAILQYVENSRKLIQLLALYAHHKSTE